MDGFPPLDQAFEVAQRPPGDEDNASQTMETFVKLFAAHQRTIWLYLSTMLPTQNDVDDVFQETSLVLWREFDKFTVGTNFGVWACTIAFNRVRAWNSKRSREGIVFSDEFLIAVSDELIDHSEYYSQRLDALKLCMKQLPSHHRELLGLRYTQGMSIESIATKLGRTVDGVYRMLSRVRHTLHDCIDRRLKAEQSI